MVVHASIEPQNKHLRLFMPPRFLLLYCIIFSEDDLRKADWMAAVVTVHHAHHLDATGTRPARSSPTLRASGPAMRSPRTCQHGHRG